MTTFITVIHVIVCVFLMLTVLLQSGKGGGMGAAFGGGNTGRVFGGSGSILGTLIGCVFLTVLENGMIMAHISGYWQQAVVGLIIIIAIVIDLARKGDLFKKE